MVFVPILLGVLRALLALTFLVSAFTKLVDRGGFKSALGIFAVPERLQAPAALLIPVFELTIAIGLLPVTSSWLTAIGALGLLLVFTAVIIVGFMRGKRPECHCFGQFSSAPASWKTVLRNGVLLAAAAAIVIMGKTRPGPSLVTWTARLTLPEVLGLVAAIVIVAVVGIESWLLAHVLRQNGRLLLRLEAAERSFGRAGVPAAPVVPVPSARPPAGLAQGAPAPVFRLDQLDGGATSSVDLLALGKPLALAFVDPNCGPCTALLPELERWQRELASQVTVAIITSGTVEANKSKLAGRGLARVLLQKKREVSAAYRAYGTPSMVIVEPDGTIGSAAAPGRDAIHELMTRFMTRGPGQAGPLPWPSAALNGGNGARGAGDGLMRPPVGKTAPDLRLLDLDGRQVSLAAFRGQATMVLFWNPGCGFCQRMLGDLKAWEQGRAGGSPQLLVVSTGDAGVNRAMGLRSPVVLDEGFGTGRAFGAGGTPSAVLVDGDGRIASELAVGGPAVMALAAGQAPALGRSV